MLQTAARQLWRPPTAGILRRRQGFRPRSPHLGALLNADHVGEVQAAYTPAKLAVITLARIGEYYSFGRIRLGQGAQLLQGDLGFGLEGNLLRNSRPGPAERSATHSWGT